MRKCLMMVALLLPVLLHAQKNSQWRGTNRDGVYSETGLLKQWPAEGPKLLWKYEGLGEGHTSVAIANGKIYITGLTDDKLMLYVLDMDGTPLTKKEVAKEWNTSHNGPRSTVCVNDGKLYVYNAFGKLICLNETTLTEVWSKDLLSDFDGKNIMWGVTESPLIVGDKIFATPGGKKNNMVALNKNTGALIWSATGEGTETAYCSPQYISDQSVPMVVTSTYDYIIAVNANTGEKLWSFPQKNKHNIHPNTPLYSNGMIFSTTGYGEGSLMLRLKNDGKAVEQVWKISDMDNRMGGAIKQGNYIYASGSDKRFWYCVDWNTGDIKYQVKDLAPCNVIFADGMLYCYSEKGEMALVKPDPAKFDMVSNFKVTLGSGPHWAHPVIHNGVMYLRHGDALMAYKVRP